MVMDVKVVLDWKSFLVLGGTFVAGILAFKLDADAAERVSIHAIDAGKELTIASNSSR